MNKYIDTQIKDGIASLVLSRGKVNAINQAVVDEIHSSLLSLQNDSKVKAIILTGKGKFFSFGFDIPEFLPCSKQEFANYLHSFTDLYSYMFLYPKPIIAAINGHAIAGGCMLASTCDYRIMVSGNAKIALNEITFGATIFAGSAELLRYWTGDKNATEILLTGNMYLAEEAKELDLIEEVNSENNLMERAIQKANELGNKPLPAFSSLKLLLRESIINHVKAIEKDSIDEFIEIWYSDETRQMLEKIQIF